MPENRHHHLVTRDDTEAPGAPRADPPPRHTHLQQVAAVNWLTGEVR
jgi:hypothetical protein